MSQTVIPDPWGRNAYIVVKVTSTGIGAIKVYHITNEYYENGVLKNTHTWDNILVPEMEPTVNKNIVTIGTPINIADAQLAYYNAHGSGSGRDGMYAFFANCKDLQTVDFSTDLIAGDDLRKGNYFDYCFLNCESLTSVNIGDYFSSSDLVDSSNPTQYDSYRINMAANNSLCCFMGCKNLTTITGVFNFADDQNDWTSQSNPKNGWSRLKSAAEYMFYGCDKLTGVNIHLTGDSNSFMSDRVYETLGLKQNQFTLV